MCAEEFDIIATTFEAGLALIEIIKSTDELYLDHDLNNFGDNCTGYNLLCAVLEKTRPFRITLVTNNVIGRRNMGHKLESFAYTEVISGMYEATEDIVCQFCGRRFSKEDYLLNGGLSDDCPSNTKET